MIMSDEKSAKTYFVRLTKSYPLKQSHRRAGYEFLPGPTPQEVELDEAGVAAVEGDRYLEFVTGKEAASAAKAQAKANQEDATNTGGGTTGRRYEGGSSTTGGDAGDGDDEEEVVPPTAEELAKDNNREALIALANEAGVEGLNYDDKQATTKKVIAEAIVAKRDATSSDEE